MPKLNNNNKKSVKELKYKSREGRKCLRKWNKKTDQNIDRKKDRGLIYHIIHILNKKNRELRGEIIFKK